MKAKHEYTAAMLAPIVEASNSYSEVLRSLGLHITGGNQQQLKKRLARFAISTSHFWHVNAPPTNKKSPAEILVFDPHAKRRTDGCVLRRALIESGVPHRCKRCGNDGTWLGEPITLDVDHVNGDWRDNRKRNLRFLCPNCHSQTPSYYRSAEPTVCSGCGEPKRYRRSKRCVACERTRRKSA